MTDFQLTDGERAHPLWQRLRAHLVDRVAEARLRNDDVSNTETTTAQLRGRIAAYKAIIALGDDRPVIGD